MPMPGDKTPEGLIIISCIRADFEKPFDQVCAFGSENRHGCVYLTMKSSNISDLAW